MRGYFWPCCSAAPLDATGIRAAAREGTLDAIATLQAGGSPAESRAAGTPVVTKTAFTARPANQVGALSLQDFQQIIEQALNGK